MKFREIIDSPCGIRYCFDLLELQSGFARKTLLDSQMMTSADAVAEAFRSLERYIPLVESEKALVAKVQFRLRDLRDISGTLNSLEEGSVPDDIELFEVKHLAMLADEISSLLPDLIECDMDGVIDALDPDGLRISTFYIYESYSMELRSLRRASEADPDDDEARDKVCMEEDRIRKMLSDILRPHCGELRKAMNGLAEVDIMLAKAIQKVSMGYVVPVIGEISEYEGLYHPQVKCSVGACGGSYQKVSFNFRPGIPSSVIGANMGGKTVLLKTLCLCQYLMQFGFAVPASLAVMTVYDNIRFCIGDEQSTEKGLSSFAAEMLRLDDVIRTSRLDGTLLALVDEPARTTNPIEGRAIVCGFIKALEGKENVSLILTTHYKVEHGGECWRVKGPTEELKMDYSLLRTESNEVPHEAIGIARRLGVDSYWMEKSEESLL